MDVREEIKQVFLKVFEMKADDFSFEKKQTDYNGWDSFAHMQIISEVEGKTGVSFEMEEVVGIESAGDILELVEKKKGGE